MHGECKCFHHVFVKVIGVIAAAAAVLFFWTAIGGSMVLGFDDAFYFQSVIVLALVMHGGKFCGCCSGHGAGFSCKDCMVDGKREMHM